MANCRSQYRRSPPAAAALTAKLQQEGKMIQDHVRKQTTKGTKKHRGVFLCIGVALILELALLASGCSVSHNKTDKGEEVTIKTPAGGMHVNQDVDPKQIGLAVYPKSRPHQDSDKDSGSVNMDMFGMK